MTPATDAVREALIGMIGRSYYDNEPGGTARLADTILAYSTEAASQPREGELDIAREMAAFEAKYPCCDHTKHRDGKIVAGRARYAEPEIDKMFSAWLSARSTSRLIATPSSRAVLLAKQYARVTEDEVAGLPIGNIAAVIRDLSAALTQRPPEQAGAVPAGWRNLRDALDDSEELMNGSVVITPEHAKQLNADVDAWEVAGDALTGEQAWDELVNVDDRTSPEEYPDMCLITRDELIDFMRRAAPPPPDAGPGEIPAGIPVNVTMLGQCDHLWAYAPTVGNYSCVRCGRRVEHGTAEHQAITATLTPKAPPQTPPDAGIGSDGAGERLALKAIKAVTATAMDGAKALSRIMAIATSAGVKEQYSKLLSDPRVALIVERPRAEWRHLFESVCTIPPEGWRCTRKPGHSGPCAAVATQPGDGGRA